MRYGTVYSSHVFTLHCRFNDIVNFTYPLPLVKSSLLERPLSYSYSGHDLSRKWCKQAKWFSQLLWIGKNTTRTVLFSRFILVQSTKTENVYTKPIHRRSIYREHFLELFLLKCQQKITSWKRLSILNASGGMPNEWNETPHCSWVEVGKSAQTH